MNGLASLFAVSGFLVMPFWALMVLAPRWHWTQRIVSSPLVAVGPIVLYAALVTPLLPGLAPALARPELPVIAGLLGTPVGATIAWAHFLALDLLAGRAIFLDARDRGLPSWLVSPLLVLTLMFAPLGLAAYAVVLGARRASRAPAVRAAARAVFDGHRGLAVVVAGCLAVAAAALGLQLFDARTLGGASVWAKPAKFAASIALVGVPLAWIIGQIAEPQARRARGAGWVIAIVAAVELGIITAQAARGVHSHFNMRTPLDSALFAVMGIGVLLLWLAELQIGILTFRQSFGDGARTWGIRLGLAATLLGGALGGFMTTPTHEQLSEARAGGHPAALGAHAVGVPDGGPGLPVTRWSTEGGDLRVPHFFGLHAMQVLPLAGLFAARRRRGARPVVALGLGWIGLTLVLMSQAMRAQPVSAPDAATLTAAALVVAGAAVVALWPRRRREEEPEASPA